MAKFRTGILLLFVLMTFSFSYKPNLTPGEILELVNTTRVNSGLTPLSLNSTLNLAAFAKAEDMLNNNYFAHVSPEGVKPWYWFKAMGYNYTYAGENLALGYDDADELVDSWMSSPSHKSNILSPFYSDLGLAVVNDQGNTVIVQMFGSKTNLVSIRQ